jgi:thiamine biosynthesis lipoprotein ApbE
MAAVKVFAHLNVTNMAIATSGNYEKFVMIDGSGIPIRLIRVQVFL